MTGPDLAASAVSLLTASNCRVHFTPAFPTSAALASIVSAVQADAIICRQGRVNDVVMDASPRLKIIARHGVGIDEVDLAAAAKRHIWVTRATGSNARAAAEHTLALILALAKDLHRLPASVSQGNWRPAAHLLHDITDLSLGLVGFGPIGQEVARLARLLGMKVAVTHQSWQKKTALDSQDVVRTDMQTLLNYSTILSLHCPLLPETTKLIGARELASLPRGALLVNTARGGLIDECALLDALNSGHLGGAALDVMTEEPPAADHPLRTHPNVILTPHVAGSTQASMHNMGMMVANAIISVLNGGAISPDQVVVSGKMNHPPDRDLA